jgi:hypothetical protein
MENAAHRSFEPAATGYIAEYMAAFDRTESFGLKAPPRLLVAKKCVDVDKTLAVLLGYFDAHEPEELMGQTLAIHVALIPLLFEATGVSFELTIGWIELGGKPKCEHGEETIRRFMVDKLAAWHRESVPFHIWLTSPACEVLDVTFGMNNGWAKTREKCARLIVFKVPDQSGDPIYHPTVVGEDFLRQTGGMVDIDRNSGS